MFQMPLHPVISYGFDKDADCNDDVCIIVKSLDVPVTPVSTYIHISIQFIIELYKCM